MALQSKKKTAKKKAKKKNARGAIDTRSRAARIKEVSREELRKKFKGVEYLRQLEQCAKDFDVIHKKLKQKNAWDNREVLKVQIDVVKAKVDLNMRRLKFVIPELKAMSFEDGDGKSLTEQFFEAMTSAAKNNNI